MWVGFPNALVPMTTEYDGGPVLGGTFPALIWHNFMIGAMQVEKERAAEEDAKHPSTLAKHAEQRERRRARSSKRAAATAPPPPLLPSPLPARSAQHRSRRQRPCERTCQPTTGQSGKPAAAKAAKAPRRRRAKALRRARPRPRPQAPRQPGARGRRRGSESGAGARNIHPAGERRHERAHGRRQTLSRQ